MGRSAERADAGDVPADDEGLVSTAAQSLNEFAPVSRFSAGTRTASSLISACQTARSDALSVPSASPML